MEIEFLVDDQAAAEKFVAELPPRLRRLRFHEGAFKDGLAKWKPDHTVLAIRDGSAVAMADCLIAADNRAGVGAIVARDKCGAYAIKAWLHMRKLFPVQKLDATHVQPTDRLLVMGRRYADNIYDQTTWVIYQALLRQYGANEEVAPTPIAITRSNARQFGIPRLTQFDKVSLSQVAAVCLRPREFCLSTKPHGVIPNVILMALGFEAVALPYHIRQKITRSSLVGIAELHGAQFQRSFVAKFTNPRSNASFQATLAGLDPDRAPITGPVFRIERPRYRFPSASREAHEPGA